MTVFYLEYLLVKSFTSTNETYNNVYIFLVKNHMRVLAMLLYYSYLITETSPLTETHKFYLLYDDVFV